MKICPEVARTLREGGPVVALESTIFTHGLPRPRNLEVALALEQEVRSRGAVPATIGIIDGEVTVGLSPDQLRTLALERTGVLKAGARDLAWAELKGLSAGTTVSGTLACAAAAGIRVFATGGIGGVHRGAQDTFDESADLPQLSRSPVILVSAGCKAILDIPLTVERLETLGIPLVGYRTREFPAFYSRTSGVFTDLSLDTPEEVAAMFRSQQALTPGVGLFVANPVPGDREIPAETIEQWLSQALAEAPRLTGKEVTPHLLAALVRLSEGRTLETNVALVLNNASLAARVALALARS